jgi:hypothetical protein
LRRRLVVEQAKVVVFSHCPEIDWWMVINRAQPRLAVLALWFFVPFVSIPWFYFLFCLEISVARSAKPDTLFAGWLSI